MLIFFCCFDCFPDFRGLLVLRSGNELAELSLEFLLGVYLDVRKTVDKLIDRQDDQLFMIGTTLHVSNITWSSQLVNRVVVK